MFFFVNFIDTLFDKKSSVGTVPSPRRGEDGGVGDSRGDKQTDKNCNL